LKWFREAAELSGTPSFSAGRQRLSVPRMITVWSPNWFRASTVGYEAEGSLIE